MSINLIEKVPANLHYPPLQKIDPNTQEVVVDDKTPSEHRFSQAAVPAILTALYKYSTTDIGAENILRGNVSTDWVNTILDDTEEEVIGKVASYSFQPGDVVRSRLDDIAAEAVKEIRENIKPNAGMMDVKNYMATQIKTILLYLPEALHMGEVVKDTTVDDNTNKMEGPISSLMHKIGSAFTKPENEAEVNTKPS